MSARLRRLVCAATVCAGLGLGHARAEEPVPIEEEPQHVLKFSNGHVRFFDVRLPPGYRGRMHIHHHDGVFVNITPSETEAEDWGRPAVRRPGRVPGETYFIGYGSRPKAHRVSNVGVNVYHVTDTEILRGCGGNVAPPAAPGDVLVDNDSVRVTRVVLEPGGSAMLQGPCGMLVAVIAGDLRLTTPGGDLRLSLPRAGFHWRDSHQALQLTNAGTDSWHGVDILVK